MSFIYETIGNSMAQVNELLKMNTLSGYDGIYLQIPIDLELQAILLHRETLS